MTYFPLPNLKYGLHYFILFLVVIFSSTSIKANSPTDLTAFYTYVTTSGTYKVSLTDAFSAQINKASGGTLSQGDYTWNSGDPLPNPAPDGKYNNIEVQHFSAMFGGLSEIVSLDLSLWNTTYVVTLSDMF